MTLVIRREPLTSAVARELITALNAELAAMYPEPGATHFRLEPEEVAEGRGAFMVALSQATPVGCGALRVIDARTAELKRMYVAPAVRGQGIAGAVLGALEAEARRLGIQQLVLETGIRQLAALALYRRSGYQAIPAFGEYVASPTTSVCLAKEL